MASEAVDQARSTNDRVSELSKAAARIGDVVELINTIAGPDQSAGAQRHHRGGARRRSRPRLCGGGVGGEGAGRADREGHRRDRPADLRHPGRDPGIGRRDQGNQRHHREAVGDLLDHCRGGGRAGRCDAGDLAQRAAGGRRAPSRSPPTSPTCSAAPPRPARPPRRCCRRRSRCRATATASSSRSASSSIPCGRPDKAGRRGCIPAGQPCFCAVIYAREVKANRAARVGFSAVFRVNQRGRIGLQGRQSSSSTGCSGMPHL